MKTFQILLVEDNPDHADLIHRALQSGGYPNTVQLARDGQEALEFLFRDVQVEQWFDDVPDLVLLDIKLPKLDGFEVLRRIKNDQRLRALPVVMLTTSTRDEEVVRAYELGANSYVCKPVRFRDFMEAIRGLQRYWLGTNKLPEAVG